MPREIQDPTSVEAPTLNVVRRVNTYQRASRISLVVNSHARGGRARMSLRCLSRVVLSGEDEGEFDSLRLPWLAVRDT
jgi:hypothetical protein